MARFAIYFLGLAGLFLLSACKKGTPEIESLRSLGGFSLDQTAVTVSAKSNPRFTVTGLCHANFSKIQISFDGQKTWVEVSSVASSSSLTCATDGKFRLEFLNDISSWIQAGSEAEKGKFYFRAISDFGNSDPQELVAQMSSAGHLILTGSHSTTSGSYKLTGRVGGSLSAPAGSFHLRSTVKER